MKVRDTEKKGMVWVILCNTNRVPCQCSNYIIFSQKTHTLEI